ncbi:LMBR1 domain-containing protein 2 homolog [Oratosquilla oratoria]|uniref:LMBR1 domain-containing protein 2 homolog n=1 Tax=Oratosquilla oratoria TaxID=337810 RepID=UPI003F76D993
MGAGPLAVEVLVAFFIAAGVLYRYGNWYRHHLVVTGAVLVAWYFSMLIVFVLPIDVSNSLYENCLEKAKIARDSNPVVNPPQPYFAAPGNNTNPLDPREPFGLPPPVGPANGVTATAPPDVNPNTTNTDTPAVQCKEPWSAVPFGVFFTFWRVVYWTSQVLTWLVLPLMQSYTKAGDFTVTAKLQSAIIDNAIYYGSYLLIVGIILLYVALRPDIDLDGLKPHAIAASASNTWGLFWLVLLLGYGLVDVPQSIWFTASPLHALSHAYFRAAKLAQERAEANERLNDLLQSLRSIGQCVGPGHALRPHLDVMESKVPAELLHRAQHHHLHTPEDSPRSGSDLPTVKALVRLHKQLLKALQHHRRVETQWAMLVPAVEELEDTYRNCLSNVASFTHAVPHRRHHLIQRIYTPVVEWYWRCRIRGYLMQGLALLCGLLSGAVVWSELTFFNQKPVLSLFAIWVNLAKDNQDYLTIEVLSTLTMAYLALCAYRTLFKVRVLNLYYLAPHHQTDEYSLIFSGMMLSRLTPPMCLNFLSLIHMDSHVIHAHAEETHYTQIMGHMDVISIISDGFNIYFPMMIVALCLATYYSLGSRLLSALGFQQFIGHDDLTTDLIDEGRTLVNRESRLRQRLEDSAARRNEFAQRFGRGESASTLYRSARQRAEELVRPSRRPSSGGGESHSASSSARLELLAGSPEVADYSTTAATGTSPATPAFSTSSFNAADEVSVDIGAAAGSRVRSQKPDKGLFDDV